MTETDFKKFDKIKYHFTGILGESYTKIVNTKGKEPSDIWTDGSSFGMKKIFESDVLLEPDWDTLTEYPFSERTGSVYCNLYDRNGPVEYSPRDLLQRVSRDLLKEKAYSYKTGA